MDNDLLRNYLVKRNLFDLKDIAKAVLEGKTEAGVGEDILTNDDLLARVAGIEKNTVEAVIKARITSMVYELVFTASPEEVMVIRQSMLEIAAILDDFRKYGEEYTRRTEIKNRGAKAE